MPVAVKIPDQQLLASPGALRQFFREGNSLVGLAHPNIVKVHACGQQDGLPYLVMQYVDGSPLTEEMKARKALEIKDLVRLLRPVARALDYIHAKNIVHRDVKPGNIRLTREGVPILVDFGIVQTGDATVWDDGKPRGSVWYMSPEQAGGQRASGRSDQYSLAVVAYEMLSGRVPFDGENPYAIVLQQRDTKAPIPSSWSSPVKAVMERVLEKDPNKRYSSCIEFIDALARAGQGRSPSPQPVLPAVARPEDRFRTIAEFQQTVVVVPIPGPVSKPVGPNPVQNGNPYAVRVLVGVGLIAILCLGLVYFQSSLGEHKPQANPSTPTGQHARKDPNISRQITALITEGDVVDRDHGLYKEAIDCYRRAGELDPGNAELQRTIKEKIGRTQQAWDAEKGVR